MLLSVCYCYCRLIEQECNLFHVLREEYHMLSSGDTHVIDSGSLGYYDLGYFFYSKRVFPFSKIIINRRPI